jgi:hypothetical protein
MKKIVFGLLLVYFVVCANAQTMADVFVKMPNDIVVQLEEAWRKDLVALYKAGKTATLENVMRGRSTLKKLTDDYLLLQSTESSTVELKLLPLVNNTYIICMVETIYAPVADSRVGFYSTEWRKLHSDDVFEPATDEWFLKTDIDRSSFAFLDVKSRLDMCLMKYNLSAENTHLTAVYTTPEYLDDELRKKAEPFLKTEPKVYKWKSGRFE